ncbi:MAG: hypothetical protein LUF80_06450 [Oscillospiraceae bacterium]|nr:hypothetical protein [Oscillospiraceae bacterium]MCD7928481.1 hypothetical protein [Oscillospiraceae bacterium]
MNLELTGKQYRRLLDMVYIGNWVLNSVRADDRFQDYDEVESLLFGKAAEAGMGVLSEEHEGEIVPSKAFVEGGIHEAIVDYENCIFFDVLAEDLARRDMEEEQLDPNDQLELMRRIDAYLEEFEVHGTDHVMVVPEE